MTDEVMKAIDATIDTGKVQVSRMEEVVKAIDAFFSEKNLKQKSRLSAQNIRGINAGYANNSFLMSRFKIENRVLAHLIEEKTVSSISLDGKGRDEVIELVKSFAPNLHEEELAELRAKLNGL